MAEEGPPVEGEEKQEERRIHAIKVFCSGPSQFFVSDQNVVLSDGSEADTVCASLNGGVILSVYEFCGKIGIPRDTPFEIFTEDIVSGAFASPGRIEAYGGIVAVVDERLALAIVGSNDHDLYVGENKVEVADGEPGDENRSRIYGSEDGLLKRLQTKIRYGLKSPGVIRDEFGYRIDRRYPPLSDVLVRCSLNRAVLIEGSDDIYVSHLPIPCDPPAKTLDDMPNILNLVREHVRA